MKEKPIAELEEHTFHIPRYQRGYRWEADQINMLLDDLFQYSVSKKEDDSSFYCVQPLVVVAKDEENKEYEVVDGQQRLTTIYLILNYLKSISNNTDTLYYLKFDGRKTQDDYVNKATYKNDIEKEFRDNIDNYYIHRAYHTIETWFKKNIGKVKKDGEVILDDNYLSKFKSLLTSKSAVQDKEKHASFLWHVIDNKEHDGALDAFKDLNYGKIPLTATENIKALLVQKDCYPDNSPAKILAHQRIASWESIANALNHKRLKGMVGDKDINLLDVIIDSVAEEIREEQGYDINRKDSNKYTVDLFDYYVIDRYLNSGATPSERSDKAEDVWKRITSRASKLLNWYDNRNLYHMIGLYSLLESKKGKDLIKEVENLESYKDEETQEEVKRSLPEIIEELKNRIGRRLKLTQYKENGSVVAGKQDLNHPELRYEGKFEKNMRSILTAFNVYTALTSKDENFYFPFDKFREFNPTSLEHIHPKSIVDGTYKEYENWFKVRKESLTKDQLDTLTQYLVSEKIFNGHVKEIEEIVTQVDDKFVKKANFKDPKDVHHIKNMALLDTATNAALQFNTMNVKRNKLLEVVEKGEPYIPHETLNAFAKKYSADQPGDMRYWLEYDRDKYLEAIQASYDYFTKNLPEK